MAEHHIVGVHVTDRLTRVPDVQRVLTEYGCNIKTRLGLHEVTETTCSGAGLLLLELFGMPEQRQALVDALRSVEGCDVQEMVFAG